MDSRYLGDRITMEIIRHGWSGWGSSSGFLKLGTTDIALLGRLSFIVGAVLYTVRCLVASLTSAHEMPVTHVVPISQAMRIKDASRDCQRSLGSGKILCPVENHRASQ